MKEFSINVIHCVSRTKRDARLRNHTAVHLKYQISINALPMNAYVERREMMISMWQKKNFFSIFCKFKTVCDQLNGFGCVYDEAHTRIPTQNSPQPIKMLCCLNLLSHWCSFLLSLKTCSTRVAYICDRDKWRSGWRCVRVMCVCVCKVYASSLLEWGNVNNMLRRIHISTAYSYRLHPIQSMHFIGKMLDARLSETKYLFAYAIWTWRVPVYAALETGTKSLTGYVTHKHTPSTST